MKYISYALFEGNEKFLFNYHLRGVYFNARMNSILCPDWHTIVFVEEKVFSRHNTYFQKLKECFNITYGIEDTAPRCESMLWRMKPVFFHDAEVVYNKDLDSVMLWKEKCALDEFVDSEYKSMGISDVSAHGIPMLGGAIAFKNPAFKEQTGLNSWDELRALKEDLSIHGQDQELLMDYIYPKIKDNHHWYKYPTQRFDNILWEADLTARHIGSAGVVEMELIRFFRRFDKRNFYELEQSFPRIFYWV